MDLHLFTALATARRSNLRMDPDTRVEAGLVKELVHLVGLAPNHHQTRPWRIAIFTGPARTRLYEVAASMVEVGNTAKRDRAMAKYFRAPVLIVVGSDMSSDPVTDRENRDAVVAGVQNLLLGATAVGLATLWSTGSMVQRPELGAVAGFEPTTAVVAIIYLGWPTAAAPNRIRETPHIIWHS
jgi:nitroreductase